MVFQILVLQVGLVFLVVLPYYHLFQFAYVVHYTQVYWEFWVARIVRYYQGNLAELADQVQIGIQVVVNILDLVFERFVQVECLFLLVQKIHQIQVVYVPRLFQLVQTIAHVG